MSSASAPVLAAATQVRRRPSLVRRLLRSRSAQIGLAVVVVLLLLGVGAPLFAPYDPNAMAYTSILAPPGPKHLFGTDDFGRDLFSRALFGVRISLLVGISVTVMTAVAGLALGLLAGFYARLDAWIMRAMDVVMAFPGILLAIGIMAVLGPSLFNIFLALAISYTPRTARVIRGQLLSLQDQEFVVAARSLGMRDRRVLLNHIAPNTIGPLLVQQSFILALAVLAESGLNFLGVGVPPDVPTLGSMLSESRTFLRSAPWVAIFPGVLISLMVLGFNLLGDGLRDVLDPRLQPRS